MVNRPLISRYPLKRGLDFLAQPVARRRRGLIERDLALAPKQFAECPVRQAVTGRRAASLKDGRLRMASRRQVEELPHQATLADARRPGDQRQAWAVRIHRLVEEAGERLDLLFAADHGDLHAFAPVERVAGGRVGSLAGEDRSRHGHLLQSSGNIDGVASYDVLVGSGHYLAGIDSDPNGEADAVLRDELRIQLR